MARLTFLGAAQQVTGSCYLLQSTHGQVLLECGLIQGGREEEARNEAPFPFDPGKITAVVLSHAHLDHSGLLPRLVKEGFSGRIYLTQASADLLEVMLNDAARLNERDVQWENKRRQRAGKPLVEPLYDTDDVARTLVLCEGFPYGQRVRVTKDVEVWFRDAGHILGSAIVELFIDEGGTRRKLVFSGDLGNSEAALLRDPAVVTEADVLLLESTYGDRDHKPVERTLAEFKAVLHTANDSGGNVLIPAFAVGRTQELLFRLGELFHAGELPQRVVFLDSPMAIATTEIYHRYQDTFNSIDSAAMRSARARTLHTWLPPLLYSRTTQESMAINQVKGGAIIIAGSGMCNGGRIQHHLKYNLWRREAHVMIVGYQAIGTPGRALVDGAQYLRLLGNEVAVKATIHTLGGFSAHAGQSQLTAWAGHFHASEPRVYLVHGEPEKMTRLAGRLRDAHGWDVETPVIGESIDL